MKVKVIRAEIREGTKQDGTPYIGCSAVVIFPDGKTAARLFLPDDVISPDEVEKGKLYDLYRDEKGNALVFDPVETTPHPQGQHQAHQ